MTPPLSSRMIGFWFKIDDHEGFADVGEQFLRFGLISTESPATSIFQVSSHHGRVTSTSPHDRKVLSTMVSR